MTTQAAIAIGLLPPEKEYQALFDRENRLQDG